VGPPASPEVEVPAPSGTTVPNDQELYQWLLCLQYVCFLLNHMYNSTLNGVPFTLLLGVTVDISVGGLDHVVGIWYL
jgi:hypothetical protein